MSDDANPFAAEVRRLRAENKLLRLLQRDVDVHGQAYEYQAPGKERVVLSPADVRVVMRHDAMTAHEAALKVVGAAVEARDALVALMESADATRPGMDLSLSEAAKRQHAAYLALWLAVDEWRSRA